jgi:hypothetical protein
MDVTSSGLIVGTSSTPAAGLQVLRNTDSTVYIGDATHSGCLAMGDSDGAGISYITVLNGVLTASDVKPAICQ